MLAAFAFVASLQSAPAPVRLRAVILTDKAHHATGVAITNTTKRTVQLIQPGDGSLDGWRSPLVAWSMIPFGDKSKHPDWPKPLHLGRCGNTNPLQLSEIVTLDPGQTWTLGMNWIWALGAGPGKYRAVFYYRNNPALETWRYRSGDGQDEVLAQLRQTTPALAVSKEAILVIGS